jgi:hypothetical protein
VKEATVPFILAFAYRGLCIGSTKGHLAADAVHSVSGHVVASLSFAARFRSASWIL